MTRVPHRYPRNDIISLTSEPVRYDLAESIGPDLKLGSLLDGATDIDLRQLDLSYGTVNGNAHLRQLIADRYGVGSEDVITMVGGMQALFLIAHILCDSGDEAVIQSPCFPNTKSAVQSVGATVIPLAMKFDEGYRLNLDRLRATLTPQTKLVSLTSPQNPSGVALGEADVVSAVKLVEEICPDAFLLIDETYREAAYGDDRVRPSMVSLVHRIISCASLSKCHGAPGLRMGWAITQNVALREQLTLGKFNTVISNSAVDEALAIHVLRQQDQIVGQRRLHLQSGLERTAQFIEAHTEFLEWVVPDAGALCCVRLKSAVFDELGIAGFYNGVKARGVRVGHGPWFGEDARIFRLGFGFLPLVDLDEALSRLSEALSEVAKKSRGQTP